jgi:hypothetical protein
VEGDCLGMPVPRRAVEGKKLEKIGKIGNFFSADEGASERITIFSNIPRYSLIFSNIPRFSLIFPITL